MERTERLRFFIGEIKAPAKRVELSHSRNGVVRSSFHLQGLFLRRNYGGENG